ncbi:hypothetical protein JRQ81_014310 [Phrynocephalus forsythii]|uniref:Uncharacterized protein n=1 Tax=Phrynocephalus forsythii TaxID=171643 RepID=A0A9Q1B3E1_9SAUR|nr:hypothetical protein JRQ81_014310 [Phrynocephalus forsythii]
MLLMALKSIGWQPKAVWKQQLDMQMKACKVLCASEISRPVGCKQWRLLAESEKGLQKTAMEEAQDNTLVSLGEALAAPVGYLVFIYVIFLIWKLWKSFPLHHKICQLMKGSFRWLLGVPETSPTLSITKAKKHLPRPPTTAVNQPRRGGSKQQLASGFPGGTSLSRAGKHSIRRLLCDDPECKICDKAAEEAACFLHKKEPIQALVGQGGLGLLLPTWEAVACQGGGKRAAKSPSHRVPVSQGLLLPGLSRRPSGPSQYQHPLLF